MAGPKIIEYKLAMSICFLTTAGCSGGEQSIKKRMHREQQLAVIMYIIIQAYNSHSHEKEKKPTFTFVVAVVFFTLHHETCMHPKKSCLAYPIPDIFRGSLAYILYTLFCYYKSAFSLKKRKEMRMMKNVVLVDDRLRQRMEFWRNQSCTHNCTQIACVNKSTTYDDHVLMPLLMQLSGVSEREKRGLNKSNEFLMVAL